MRNNSFLKYIILTILLLGCLSAFAQQKNLKILFTCDTNGHPLAFTHMNEKGQGGMAARSTLIKQIGGNRQKNNVLLLDTGSVFGGRPESNVLEGMPDIVGMNKLKYDCAAIGVTELQRKNSEFEKLNQKAEFTYVGANVYYMNKVLKRTELLSDDYFVKKVGGLRVGIFSVITEDAKFLIHQKFQGEYVINDPIKAANLAVSKLKREKQCDIIIALTHLGYYPDDESVMDVKALANNVKNINLIIDGRTNIDMQEAAIVNDVPICQVGKWGLSLGEVNLQIKNNKVVGFNFRNHSVNRKVNGRFVGGSEIEEDHAVLNAIKASMASYNYVAGGRIVKSNPEFNFDLANVRFQECMFGNLLCDAVMNYTRCDLTLQTTGCIDPEAKVDPNKINRFSFDKVIVYDNPIVVVGMTGRMIQQVLQYSMKRQGYGSFLQIGGISYEYKPNGEVYNITMNQQPIDFNHQYRVAITTWMHAGGDGYNMISNCPIKYETVMTTREILYDYVESFDVLPIPVMGRIKAAEE